MIDLVVYQLGVTIKITGFESATSHAVVYFLQQGTPFIYQGQEIGMTNYPLKVLKRLMMLRLEMNIKL